VVFLRQFLSPLVYILLAAAIIKFVMGSHLDGGVILGVLFLMAGIGFSQETRAEKAMAALIQLAAPKAKVKRDSKVMQVLAREIVPGDIISLETGDKVPADARLIELSSFKTNEAPLTGESMPVDKHTDSLSGEIAIPDRKNMVYMGTVVTAGRATAIVTATGMKTEIGKIATAIQEVKPEKTPLQKTITNIKSLGIDCLVCVGGDGTLSIASRLFKDGVPIVGIPKTIDNDVRGTDITVGFDSAVSIATEAIDRAHTTAQSHHRIMIVEVMGRDAGWIALYAGIAGGGDVILIPEIPYEPDVIADKVRDRNKRGKRFTIVVVAEGARPKGGDIVIKRVVKDGTQPVRLGGIGFALASQLEQITGIENRAVVIGHLQRGGPPTPPDRILATRMGTKAVDMIRREKYGYMVGVQGNSLTEVPLEVVIEGPRRITPDDPLIQSARSLSTCFGD